MYRQHLQTSNTMTKYKDNLFEIQKQANDEDFKQQQEQLKKKKEYDQKRRKLKEDCEAKVAQMFSEVEAARSKKVESAEDKKIALESQLNEHIGTLAELNERQSVLTDRKEEVNKKIKIKEAKLLALRNEKQELADNQREFEGRIYKQSL